MLFCYESLADGLYPVDGSMTYTITETGGVKHRGPIREPKEDYIICLGAGQTFGRFSAKPFPDLLTQKIGRPVLNFGYGRLSPMDLWWSVPHRRILLGASLVIAQASLWRSDYLDSLSELLPRLPEALSLRLLHEKFNHLQIDPFVEVPVTCNGLYPDQASHERIAETLAGFLNDRFPGGVVRSSQ